jgi:transposase
MPTALQMPPELNDADFVVLARSALDGRVRLRLLALAHLKEGKSPREIGAMLKVHPKPVLKWLRRFRAGGIAGLAE